MFTHVRLEAALAVGVVAAGLAVAMAIPPAGASESTRHVAAVAPRSTVTVTIPAFYFDPTDGLPATVTKANTYTVTVRGMATAGTGGGTFTLTAAGGTMTSCKATAKEITPVTLKCTVKVSSPKSLVITAIGATKKFPSQSTKFVHAVR
jgi:hypothetical protein